MLTLAGKFKLSKTNAELGIRLTLKNPRLHCTALKTKLSSSKPIAFCHRLRVWLLLVSKFLSLAKANCDNNNNNNNRLCLLCALIYTTLYNFTIVWSVNSSKRRTTMTTTSTATATTTSTKSGRCLFNFRTTHAQRVGQSLQANWVFDFISFLVDLHFSILACPLARRAQFALPWLFFCTLLCVCD